MMGLLGTLGSLNVLFSADTTQFTSAMDRAAFMAERDLQRISSRAKFNGAMIATAMTAAATAFAVGMKRIIDDADELGKMSQKVGISVQSLSAFRHAAELAGTEFETMTKGIARFSRAASDAQNGLETAARPFRQLSVAIEDSGGGLRDVESMLLDVADKFSQMEDGTKKAALAQELFGRSGVELIPFLNEGRAGIEAIRKEAERLGIVFDEQTAKSAENFNDNMTRLSSIMRGVMIGVGNGLIPVLSKITENMKGATNETDSFKTAGKALATVLVALINSGMVINEVFQTAGRTLGDAAFVIYSMVQGKFQQATDAMVKSSKDTNKAWGDLAKDLEKNWDALDEKVADSAQKARDSITGPMFEVTQKMEDNMKRIESLGQGVGQAFGTAFDNAALEGMKFRDVMLGLLKDIERALFKSLVSQPLVDAISGAFSQWGGLKRASTATKTVSVQAASRHGNMFSFGDIVPFANGGIIAGPVSWPMSGGRRGLAGEAGQEVIAPLFRTSGGDMGVKSVAPRVEVNVYAPEGSRVKQERKFDGDREQINIMIDEAVAGNIGRPGSKTHRSMRNTFGVSQALTAR